MDQGTLGLATKLLAKAQATSFDAEAAALAERAYRLLANELNAYDDQVERRREAAASGAAAPARPAVECRGTRPSASARPASASPQEQLVNFHRPPGRMVRCPGPEPGGPAGLTGPGHLTRREPTPDHPAELTSVQW